MVLWAVITIKYEMLEFREAEITTKPANAAMLVHTKESHDAFSQ